MKMGEFTKDSINMTLNTAKVFTHGLTVKKWKVLGKKENNTVKENSQT